MLSGSSIDSLQRAFQDPSSPFYLREGEVGPASPDEHPPKTTNDSTGSLVAVASATPVQSESDFADAAAEARKYALSQGYDPDSFYEQKVVWGDLDSFRHVNNTRYVRYLESGRIQWMTRLGEEVGGPSTAADLLSGRGIGIILKSISVDFKRPVVFPDTLLISHRPYPSTPPSETHFHNAAVIYSYAQRAVVATSDSVLVWYDYEQLKRTRPSEAMRHALEARIRACSQK